MTTSWHIDGDFAEFRTGTVSGKYLCAGHYQGLRELVYQPKGVSIVAGETLPGLVSPYRVFANGRRYADIRDRPTKVELVPEGLRITNSATHENPLELVTLHSWSDDTLDIRYTLSATIDMVGFEMGVASYFAPGFRGFVSRQSNTWGEEGFQIVPVDVNPLTDVYALFPRSEAEMKTLFDGRWDLPPYPIRYSVPAYFAHPLAYRRHAKSGVTVVGLADPTECYAICLPVNDPPEDPDPARGYQAIYFYLFGRDLRRGETAAAHLRFVVGQDLSESEILARAGSRS